MNPRSRILIDGHSARVLLADRADEPLRPASLVKMMTLYLVFEALRAGRVFLHDPVVISDLADDLDPRRERVLGLMKGRPVPFHVLIPGMTVCSGNDAALTAAEHVAGSVATFVDLMIAKAKLLKLTATKFTNPSGLPQGEQISTARDMVRLAYRLYTDFPECRPWLSMETFFFRARRRKSTNDLMSVYPGMNGIKTGTTRQFGLHMAASAVRGNVALICVVTGCPNKEIRASAVTELLDWGFEKRSRFEPRRSAATDQSAVDGDKNALDA